MRRSPTYRQKESQAWNQYLEHLDRLNSQLEHTRVILGSACITAWSNAGIAGISRSVKVTSAFMMGRNNSLRGWSETGSAAYAAYQVGRVQMLQQPPADHRQAEPPGLDVSNLLATVPRRGEQFLLAQLPPGTPRLFSAGKLLQLSR